MSSSGKSTKGSKMISCVSCHDRKVKCSKTQPCINCIRRKEECIWIGDPPAPIAATQDIGSPSSPLPTKASIHIENGDLEQRYRAAVTALARYLLPIKYLYMMHASAINDTHVSGGWVPLEAANVGIREFLTRHEAKAYRRNDAQHVALLLAVTGERLAFCKSAHAAVHNAVAEGATLPPTLTGFYTHSLPARDLAPHELARSYGTIAELAMQLGYEYEETVPVGWHALALLHRLEHNVRSSRHLASALRQMMVRAIHRPPRFQSETTPQWREHRLRIWWGLYWEDRVHAVVFRVPRNSMIIDDLPPPLNMGQEAVVALVGTPIEPPSFDDVNDGSALFWRAMISRCLDGVCDDQHLAPPGTPIPPERALMHAQVLSNLRHKIPRLLKMGTPGTNVALRTQRVQIAAVIAAVQLKILSPQVVAGYRMGSRHREAENLICEAAAELVQVQQELILPGVSSYIACSSPALAILYSPILLFEAVAHLVLDVFIRKKAHQYVEIARLGFSFLEATASRQKIMRNCLTIMSEMLQKRGFDVSVPLSSNGPPDLPEIYASCTPTLDKNIMALLLDAAGESKAHREIQAAYAPYMGGARAAYWNAPQERQVVTDATRVEAAAIISSVSTAQKDAGPTSTTDSFEMPPTSAPDSEKIEAPDDQAIDTMDIEAAPHLYALDWLMSDNPAAAAVMPAALMGAVPPLDGWNHSL